MGAISHLFYSICEIVNDSSTPRITVIGGTIDYCITGCL